MDPIADMLIQIKNGSLSGRPAVVVPHSKLKLSVLETLKKSGYVEDFSKKTRKSRPVLEVKLAYDASKKPLVHDVERISKPSKRVYVGVHEVRSVRNGYGIAVLSTPKGVMTDKEARAEHVGGEMLLTIW